jgi:bacterioferritin (cytochrome b1)
MPNDRDKVLDRLQAVLKDEHLSAFCYQVHAEESRAMGHERLARRLEAIASDHQRHIQALRTKITTLGAEPRDFTPPPAVEERMRNLPRHDLCMALEHDLKSEDTEIEAYATLAQQTDEHTAEMCNRITHDDREHAAWLRDELVRGLNLENEVPEGEEISRPPER